LKRSRTAQFFHDHVLVKEPGTAVVTPWHHDMPYYCVGAEGTVSFWIALDPVPQETSLRCLAGSHRWGDSFRPKRFDGTDLYADDRTPEIPDIDGRPERYPILSWPLEPGDAVAFDFRTVHGASANTSPLRRRIVSMRWVGDNAVFLDRQGKGSPPFAHLTLKDGDLLTGPDFPVIQGAVRRGDR
jgi:ectoine hydroxylase-related dioxygenase (phytanoyl-CoA dioxygenase family)